MDRPPQNGGTSGIGGWIIGAVIIVTLIVAGVGTLRQGGSGVPQRPSEVTPTLTAVSAAHPPPIAPTYADPSKPAVERAFKEEQHVYTIGGLSGLARRSQQCFNHLANTLSYGELDFCIAFDAYATRQAVSEMGQASIPPNSYFASPAARANSAAVQVIGAESDPAARIADIRALAAQVAATDAESATPATAGGVPATHVDGKSDPNSTTARLPSFDCAKAKSDNLLLVCAAPVLANDDREMAEAYTMALARSAAGDRLRAEQRAWIRIRNNTANDVSALHNLYRTRTGQLNAQP